MESATDDVFQFQWLYALGGIGEAMMMSIIAFYGTDFLLNVVMMSPHRVAILMFVVRFFDAVNDPIIGYFSDRYKFKYNGRRPLMYYTFFFASVMYVSIWSAPRGLSDGGLMFFYIVMQILFETVLSIYRINYDALTSEMTTRYEERMPLVTKKQIAFVVASAIAVITHSRYMEFTSEDAGRGAVVHSYLVSALVVAAVNLPFAWIATKFSFERTAEASVPILVSVADMDDHIRNTTSTNNKPATPKNTNSAWVLFMQDMRVVVTNKNYLLLCVVYMFVMVVVNVLQAMLILYVRYVVKRENEEAFTATIVRVQSGVIGGLVLYLGITRCGLIKNKKRALIMCLLGLMGTCLSLLKFVQSDAVEVFFGIWISGALMPIQSMLPDSIDVGESIHAANKRLDGTYYAFFTVMQKVSSAVALGVINLVLGTGGYVPGAATQTDDVVHMLRMLFVVLPPVLLFMCLFPLYFYDLSEERLVVTQQELVAKRKETMTTTTTTTNSIDL